MSPEGKDPFQLAMRPKGDIHYDKRKQSYDHRKDQPSCDSDDHL